jgi:hypothetical protein
MTPMMESALRAMMVAPLVPAADGWRSADGGPWNTHTISYMGMNKGWCARVGAGIEITKVGIGALAQLNGRSADGDMP